jgi:hypothetical protein
LLCKRQINWGFACSSTSLRLSREFNAVWFHANFHFSSEKRHFFHLFENLWFLQLVDVPVLSFAKIFFLNPSSTDQVLLQKSRIDCLVCTVCSHRIALSDPVLAMNQLFKGDL